jgi:3-isopropylmalate dehydratase small subunit
MELTGETLELASDETLKNFFCTRSEVILRKADDTMSSIVLRNCALIQRYPMLQTQSPIRGLSGMQSGKRIGLDLEADEIRQNDKKFFDFFKTVVEEMERVLGNQRREIHILKEEKAPILVMNTIQSS